MPVTARLSRRFYDQLGDETTNELVEWLNAVDSEYHTKLESLYERSMTQFRAELRAGLAEQDAKLEREINTLRVEMHSGMAALHTAVARLEARLAWQMTGTVVTVIGLMINIGAQFLRR